MASVFCFGKLDLVVDIREYPNGRIAIQLIDSETGKVYKVVSHNVPKILLEGDEVLINDEEGELDFLKRNNVLEDTGKIVCSGYLILNLCKLLPKEVWGPKEAIKT